MTINLYKPPLEEPKRERKVFYVDVGSMSPKEAKKYLKLIKAQLHDNYKLARR